MPSLTSAFAGDPSLREVNSLLMIVGSLVIVCLLLIMVLFFVIRKIRNLTKKLDSWELLIIRNVPNVPPATESTDAAEEVVEEAVEAAAEEISEAAPESEPELESEEPESSTP